MNYSEWATWNVRNWLFNDQDAYDDLIEELRTFPPDPDRDDHWADAVKAIAYQLLIEPFVGDLHQASLASDFISHSMNEVDWEEIAREIREEHLG